MKPLLKLVYAELGDDLGKSTRTRIFREGEQIFAEGDKADFLPIVITGKVKMIRFLEPGKEVIIGLFGDGEMFAVPPVFDGGIYPSTAIAMEPTNLLLIPRSNFLDLLRESSEFSFAVIDWMCAMLREKTATIQNLATASPESRIAAVLLRLAEKDPSEKTISLRRQDIAEMAGITTETTIRVIRRFAAQGLVKIIHGKIVIEDPELLRPHLA